MLTRFVVGAVNYYSGLPFPNTIALVAEVKAVQCNPKARFRLSQLPAYWQT